MAPKIRRITESATKHLTSQSTLNDTATLSLHARVDLFNNMRPAREPITKTDLRNLYRKSKITFKKVISKVRFRRTTTAAAAQKDAEAYGILRDTAVRCARFGKDLVMIDESTFSQCSYNAHAWAGKGSNVMTTHFWKSEPPIAVAAAVSASHGLIHYSMVPHHHNNGSYLEFLRQLRLRI